MPRRRSCVEWQNLILAVVCRYYGVVCVYVNDDFSMGLIHCISMTYGCRLTYTTQLHVWEGTCTKFQSL